MSLTLFVILHHKKEFNFQLILIGNMCYRHYFHRGIRYSTCIPNRNPKTCFESLFKTLHICYYIQEDYQKRNTSIQRRKQRNKSLFSKVSYLELLFPNLPTMTNYDGARKSMHFKTQSFAIFEYEVHQPNEAGFGGFLPKFERINGSFTNILVNSLMI